jgi:hypothetical protein
VLFIKKKITLHSPIFIRYSNFQFEISIQQGKLQFLETTKKRENLNMAENRTLVFSKQNPYIENLFLKANNRSEKNTCKDYQKEFVGTVRDEMVESLKNQHQTLNRKQALHKISLNSLTDSTVENGFLFKRSFEIWKKIETNQNKIYFFTSFGVLIGYKITVQNTESYYITDVFLETTPGRLIFSLNYKNSYIGTNT